MKFISGIVAVMALPVMILNLLGGLVGGVWLLYLGEWKVVGACLIFALFGNYVIMGPMLISLIFALPAEAAAKKGNQKTLMFWAGLASFYTALVMIVWASGSLVLLSEFAHKKGHILLPFLLCSYGVATAPWASMAQKEMDASGHNPSAAMTGYLSIGYAFAMVAALLGADYGLCIAVIAAAGLGGTVINLIEAAQLERARREFSSIG